MNQELPKWVQLTLVVVLVLMGLMMFMERDKLHVYATYFREKSPEIQVQFDALSSAMDEAAVRKHFDGVPLQCNAENGNLGDRACYSAIDRADGMPAMTLVVFFSKGKLVRAVVQMPWWSHGTWFASLKSRYGAPQHGGTLGGWRGPVSRWTIPSGYLEMNRDRGYNPLSWSAAIWTQSLPN
jgi:hypothetical protein